MMLRVRGLTVRYGRLTAVDGIDLDVAAGRIHVVLGANGAGKSSALRGVCGRVRPAAGTVELGGRDLTGRPAWRAARAGLVLVPEGREIVAPLTVEENLLVGAYANRSAGHRRRTLDEVYTMFPVLAQRRGSPGGLLSGGEQQMLAFGRALMADPAAVLLDEPSMGLAPVMVERVLGAVRGIADRGIAVLMVEQNATALGLADEASVMERGKLVLGGPAADVVDDPRVTQAFLGVAS
ncbi:ABC transporter ATP-binding protein [Pseudonocardia kunmingensis]|uniref:Amino acid/amide ABC transporter ATP-binding protein 2 (HAAT family) n=1 Tax=Pseudonocardia kunmingensis TaxID=630975 RepID=A0A543CXM0_9PSEU|nr:ABC transporter ATP-binding protein [Pseudonocardia kunmingensis]TQM01853.1 amino acid/amide ABC transporter ATP-binding protein 2 (HAAT family) [Pseudonocardia kunmingensis]